VLSLVALGVLIVVGTFAVLLARTEVPAPNDVATAQTSIVYWNDGKIELGRLGDANRINVTLDQVPLDVQHAVLSAEDREFYDHGGFSPKGIARAIWNNVSGGSLQGGSTITQQYAKNAFLTQERTLSRKLQELLLSVKLETSVSKDQILSDYLNTIYFGRGSYGIQTAAQQYFGRSVSRIDLGQAAALAAIIRSPGGYAPEANLEKLRGRWNYVLDGMVEKGWITPAQRATAIFPRFNPRKPANRFGGTNGYLLDAVRQELFTKGITEDDLNRGGLRVVSTFDRRAQDAAVTAVDTQAPQIGVTGLRIGLAAVRPGTGEVIAMYGGTDFITSPVNNATDAIGQAGSTFKPFALAAAIEQDIGLGSMWNGNSGITIDNYKVNNYGNQSWGLISLLVGTEKSVNSVYVALSQQVGYDKVVDAAIRAGIPENTPALLPVRSVALGVASPHVIDVAGAYATFAARGQRVTPTVLKQVRGANGGVLFTLDPTITQAFSSDVADTVNFALAKVVTNGTGKAALALGRPAAGKTGTTNENKSAWFVGYTPELAAAVMFVKDGPDGNPVTLSGVGGMTSVTGGSFPARVWTAFMKAVLEGEPVQDFTPPPASFVTAAPTLSVSVSVSPSLSASVSPSVSQSPSPTASPSASLSASPSPSASTSASGTPTPTPTGTTTVTPTPTPTP